MSNVFGKLVFWKNGQRTEIIPGENLLANLSRIEQVQIAYNKAVADAKEAFRLAESEDCAEMSKLLRAYVGKGHEMPQKNALLILEKVSKKLENRIEREKLEEMPAIPLGSHLVKEHPFVMWLEIVGKNIELQEITGKYIANRYREILLDVITPMIEELQKKREVE